ncbi:MAG: type IV secretory system conjugative DNA transfer family protein [Helicobacteraceae bacterium]
MRLALFKILAVALVWALHLGVVFFLLRAYYFPDLSARGFLDLDLLELYKETLLFKYKYNFCIYTLFSLLAGVILIAGVIFFESPHDDYGNARFAKLADVKNMGLNSPSGIILGKFKNTFIRTKKPLAVLVFAPPGTGKTASIAIPNLLLSDNSFFTLDVKGELYALTANIRRRKGSNVLLFDPMSPESSKFNPLDETLLSAYSWDNKIGLINQISQLIYISERSDYWVEQGRQTFVTIGLYLLHTQGGTSIPAIRSFSLSDMQEELRALYAAQDLSQEERELKLLNLEDENTNFFKLWLSERAKDKTLPIRVQEGLRSLALKPENEFGSVISSFLSPLEVFSQEQIAANTSKNDFDIMSFRSQLSDCYIRINEADMDTLKSIIRIFLDFNIKRLMSVLPSAGDKTITLMLDEFPRFGRLDFIMELPALSRAYKIPPIFICQSFSQIKETYKEKAGTIQSTTAYKVVFPQSEFETAKLFSDLVGNYTRKKISKSGKNFESKSASVSYEGVKLISEQDILSLDKNTVFILAINHYNRPIKATPYMYFKDKKLLDMIERAKKIGA